MREVRAVEGILRRWDPIGVQPGTVAPADEYDSYAPHIVSMVKGGCSVEELAAHLERLSMGLGPGSPASRAHSHEFAVQIVGTLRETITMYRPVGPKELKLLEETGFTRWPPRLPEQPIFYPVTNEQYAIEIATRWNVKDDGIGYVTRFAVRSSFMQRYEIQTVGDAHHTEWWVPAEELEQLNDNIVGAIEVIGEYRKQA